MERTESPSGGAFSGTGSDVCPCERLQTQPWVLTVCHLALRHCARAESATRGRRSRRGAVTPWSRQIIPTQNAAQCEQNHIPLRRNLTGTRLACSLNTAPPWVWRTAAEQNPDWRSGRRTRDQHCGSLVPAIQALTSTTQFSSGLSELHPEASPRQRHQTRF